MKHLLIGLASAATLIAAVPASAEVVVRTPGAGVVVGDGYHREGWRERHWHRSYAECRTVRVKTRLPNGDVVVRTRRSC